MNTHRLVRSLASYGADITGALERFGEEETLYVQCLVALVSDKNIPALGQAVSSENYNDAFSAAHTIKGLAGNLGLTPLYKKTCELVEFLRVKDYEKINNAYEEFIMQFGRFEELIMHEQLISEKE